MIKSICYIKLIVYGICAYTIGLQCGENPRNKNNSQTINQILYGTIPDKQDLELYEKLTSATTFEQLDNIVYAILTSEDKKYLAILTHPLMIKKLTQSLVRALWASESIVDARENLTELYQNSNFWHTFLSSDHTMLSILQGVKSKAGIPLSDLNAAIILKTPFSLQWAAQQLETQPEKQDELFAYIKFYQDEKKPYLLFFEEPNPVEDFFNHHSMRHYKGYIKKYLAGIQLDSLVCTNTQNKSDIIRIYNDAHTLNYAQGLEWLDVIPFSNVDPSTSVESQNQEIIAHRIVWTNNFIANIIALLDQVGLLKQVLPAKQRYALFLSLFDHQLIANKLKNSYSADLSFENTELWTKVGNALLH